MDKDGQREGVITEADTCREYVTPRLIEAGWSTEPHAIGEQRSLGSAHETEKIVR